MPGGGLTAPKKLSPELADIVGKKEASRGELMKLLWAYLKEKNLQDPENKQYFTPDKKMAKVFGEDKIKAFTMAKYLGRTSPTSSSIKKGYALSPLNFS